MLVVSETGLVYTFTTAKLQPLVTQPEGKNLIQACLNSPHGQLPSSMPIGAPIGRTSAPLGASGTPPSNLPGGLSISGAPKDDEGGEPDEEEASHEGRGKKRQRRGSTSNSRGGGGSGPQTSPHAANAAIPPAPLNIPQQPQQPLAPSPQQQHQQVPSSSQYQGYGHHQQQQSDPNMYGGPHMMPPPNAYSYSPTGGPGGQQQQLGGLAAAAAQQHGHWAPGPPAPVGQGGYGGRR